MQLIQRRIEEIGEEDQYLILVELPYGKSFRVNIGSAFSKGTSLDKLIVSRNDFPKRLFE